MPERSVKKPTPQAVRAREAYAKVPLKDKADDPGRYSKTPHEYGDVLITGGKLGGPLERDLLYWIERHTWGANTSRDPKKVTRPEFAKLSLTQFARLCQAWDEDKGRLRPVERKSVAVALARLERDGIIEARDRTGCGKTTAKMYKLTPERWKAAPPYKPPTARQIEEAEAEAEETETEDLSADNADNADNESTVEDGKMSRPQAVQVKPNRTAEPVTVRLVYNPTGFSFPVTFRARTGPNGRIQVSASPHGQIANCSRPQLQRFASHSPSQTEITAETKRLNLFSGFISDFILNFWGKSADQVLVDSIISASDGAPVEVFARVVEHRFRRSHHGARHSTGLLIELAKDAARTWKAEQRAKTTQQRPSAAAPANRTTDELPTLPEIPEPPPAPICGDCKGTGKGKDQWTNVAGTYAARPTVCGQCKGTGRKAAK